MISIIKYTIITIVAIYLMLALVLIVTSIYASLVDEKSKQQI